MIPVFFVINMVKVLVELEMTLWLLGCLLTKLKCMAARRGLPVSLRSVHAQFILGHINIFSTSWLPSCL